MSGNSKVTIIVCSIMLLGLVAFAAIMVNLKNDEVEPPKAGDGEINKSQKAIKTICQSTNYKKTCEKSLSTANTSDPKDLILLGFKVGEMEIRRAMEKSAVLQQAADDPRTNSSYHTCGRLMESAIDDLHRSLKKFDQIENAESVEEFVFDLKVWLSGSITSLDTCFDVFENTTGDASEKIKKVLKTSREIAVNGLDIIAELENMLSLLMMDAGNGRKLLFERKKIVPVNGEYPYWLNEERRGLVESKTLKANVIVAQDGSGKYKTINEALKEIPPNNIIPFVIHVKKGVYHEQLLITKKMSHVVLLGDGPALTKITADKNEVAGQNIFINPTVSVEGSHFIAKDICFENTAGSQGMQAVALRISGDMAIVYNCQMDGYQDTLYAHKHRQFYRDCTISSTVDFIFGDAVCLFQNCKIIVRRPDSDKMQDQSCMITAQGRSEEKMPTGIVLQNCLITADVRYYDPSKPPIKSYLGRPWKTYSRTVIMHSQIDKVIEPAGWEHWPGTPQNGKTCWYAEYGNKGPGANPEKRAAWPCIKQKIPPQLATEFTALKFLGGDLWIPQTGIPYVPGMIKDVGSA